MIRLFRRARPPAPPSEAELARRLTDPGYACACCGTVLGAATGVVRPAAPFGWKNPPRPAPDEAFDAGGGDVLTENYARFGRDTLLRALLPVPVRGTEGQVFLGVWCSLKIGQHARFRSAQGRGDAERLGEMDARLWTQLPPLTGPLLTEGRIAPSPGGRKPLYWITSPRHPFHAAQAGGMTATEILALYAAFGRGDMVAHLTA